MTWQHRWAIGVGSVWAVLVLVAPSGWTDPVRLVERTPVRLRLAQELATGKNLVGEAVEMEVREAVKDRKGQILIAPGARVIGKLVTSEKGSVLGRSARIEIEVNEVEAIDGTRIELRALPEPATQDGKPPVVSLGGSKSLKGYITRGKGITLKQGTELQAYVGKEAMVDPDKKPVPPPESATTAPPPAAPTAPVTPAAPAAPVAPATPTAPTAPAAPAAPTPPPAPATTFSVLSSYLAGSNLLGEIKNEGPGDAAAEIIVLIRAADGTAIAGAGTTIMEMIKAGEKRSYSVPITGNTQGTLSVEVKPKVPAK